MTSFLVGSAIAVLSLILAQNIPEEPREGNEAVWGASAALAREA